jgi:hypothetical protein
MSAVLSIDSNDFIDIEYANTSAYNYLWWGRHIPNIFDKFWEALNDDLFDIIKITMITITKVFASFSTRGKAFYPFFMASDYTPLEYSPHYVRFRWIRHKGHHCWKSISQIFIKSTIQHYLNFYKLN